MTGSVSQGRSCIVSERSSKEQAVQATPRRHAGPRRFQVAPGEAGLTLAALLARRLGLSGRRAKALLDQRAVFVNQRRVWMARHTLRARDWVEVHAPPAAEPARRAEPPRRLYEDADYVVVNKPPGRLSNGPDSVEADWRRHLNETDLRAVHRLDRDTSGCLLLARSPAAFERMVDCFRDQKVLKRYHVLAAGHVDRGRRVIQRAVEGRPARTLLHVLDANRRASHLLVTLPTGRTHQIRRHLAQIGHAVLGDRTYATRLLHEPILRAVPRQMLHAARLAVRHPVTGARIDARAPLPGDFLEWMRRLRLK